MLNAIIWSNKTFGESAKTADALIRMGKRYNIIAVVDEVTAGKDAGEVLKLGTKGIPIVSDFCEVRKGAADYLLIVGPSSRYSPNELDREIKEVVLKAIEYGLNIVNSTYFPLERDPEVHKSVKENLASLEEARRVPRLRWFSGDVLAVSAKIILTVGSDLSCGKMTTAYKLAEYARSMGINAAFVATGHTGWLIGADAGVSIEMVPGDFMAGAVEEAILSVANYDIIFVEGQSSLTHPAFGAVALSLLQGASPGHLILCVNPQRSQRLSHKFSHCLPINDEIALNEKILDSHTGGRVVSISLMGKNLPDSDIETQLTKLEDQTGLPATDPVRVGTDKLMNHILSVAYNDRSEN